MSMRYDWTALIRDIQDKSLMTQAEIADRLNINQQTVSKIMNAHLNPGIKRKSDLLELAAKEGIDVETYRTDLALRKLESFIKDRKGRELIESYLQMSAADRKRFIKYAEKL
ncbi:MAG TPA: hypothetical protein DET40_04820 [Lentisphaeria bacterium]|nr:MAG: hypothetical protein A2X45_13395 [Lentisphaerae bacterium GWF2_50_93]HCE42848.1 hypothetical protein [Lentisphaeria bacterium]